MAGWRRGGCAPTTTAIGTTTRSAAAARTIIVCIAGRMLALQVVPNRLENHIQIALDAKSRAQRRDVKLVWTEVVEDRGAAIEERLNVDELPRPVPLAEDLLTEHEATRSQFLRAL
jgi:predicted GIY-YIG superfamily endonuclease